MDKTLIDDVEVFPEEALTIKQRSHKLFHQFFLQVHHFEGQFHDFALVHCLSLCSNAALKFCSHFCPRGFALKGEVSLCGREYLINFVENDVADACDVPAALGLLGGLVGGFAALQESLDVFALFGHEGLDVVESSRDLHHRPGNVSVVFESLPGLH